MARKCYFCGKGPVTGYNVSRSNKKTKRRWNPNLQKIRIITENGPEKHWVCTSCIRQGKVKKYIKFSEKKEKEKEK